jgi:hypothetical protein
MSFIEAGGAPLSEVALEGNGAAGSDVLGGDGVGLFCDSEGEEVLLTISAAESDVDAGKVLDEFAKMLFCAPSRKLYLSVYLGES